MRAGSACSSRSNPGSWSPLARRAGGHWFGFSTRARVIAYNKDKVHPGEIQSCEDLADLGEQKAEQWAKGVRANLAQEPKGGDTDQLKFVGAGACDVTISNQYYYARLARSQKSDEKQVAEKIGVVLPNQKSWGTHVNISGASQLRGGTASPA